MITTCDHDLLFFGGFQRGLFAVGSASLDGELSASAVDIEAATSSSSDLPIVVTADLFAKALNGIFISSFEGSSLERVKGKEIDVAMALARKCRQSEGLLNVVVDSGKNDVLQADAANLMAQSGKSVEKIGE